MLIDKFHSGMNRCNKETLHLREAASSATGLSLKSINVGELSLAGYVYSYLLVSRVAMPESYQYVSTLHDISSEDCVADSIQRLSEK